MTHTLFNFKSVVDDKFLESNLIRARVGIPDGVRVSKPVLCDFAYEYVQLVADLLQKQNHF